MDNGENLRTLDSHSYNRNSWQYFRAQTNGKVLFYVPQNRSPLEQGKVIPVRIIQGKLDKLTSAHNLTQHFTTGGDGLRWWTHPGCCFKAQSSSKGRFRDFNYQLFLGVFFKGTQFKFEDSSSTLDQTHRSVVPKRQVQAGLWVSTWGQASRGA